MLPLSATVCTHPVVCSPPIVLENVNIAMKNRHMLYTLSHQIELPLTEIGVHVETSGVFH